MAQGAAWMVALRWSIRGIGLVSTVVLAHLLVPADFGLVAIAAALAGALEAMSEFGFQIALIQNQRADRRHYDTAWTLGLIRGLTVAGALALCAGPLATAFSDPRLEPILFVLAVGVIVTSLENVGVVDFRKDLQFHKEFVYRAAAKVAAFIVTVPAAIILENYWALVLGILTGQVGRVALSYAMCDYRPRLHVSVWRELIIFSKWLLLNNALYFAYSRVDTFLIGRLAGAQSLGLFRIAQEIASLPTTEMVAPIRAAILPGYAKLASDQARLRASFATTFGTIVIVAVPVAVGLGLIADPLVWLVLGEQWREATRLLEILCVAGAINVCTANTWPVFIALGRPWINAALMGLGVTLLVPLLVWTVRTAGAPGAAWAMVAVSTVLFALNLVVTLRLLRLSSWRLLAQTWRTAVAVIPMSGAMFVVEEWWGESAGILETGSVVLASIVIGAATYLVSLGLLWRWTGWKHGPEQTVIRIVQISLSSMSGLVSSRGRSANEIAHN
jgi:PST family polysaccharide transporter